MDTTITAASPITADIGGKSRVFRRLSMRDFATIKGAMPVDGRAERKYLSEFDVHRWAGTCEGALVVLAVSAGLAPQDGEAWSEATDVVSAWGSIVQRATIASLVVAESLTMGEAPLDPVLPGDENRPDPTSTTRRRPFSLLGTVRGWVTRGRSRLASGH